MSATRASSALLTLEPPTLRGENGAHAFSGGVGEHVLDLLDRHVEPPQGLDDAGVSDLRPAVAAIARRLIDLWWGEKPDIVVVPQGVRRQPADVREPSDRHQVIPSHETHGGLSGDPKVKQSIPRIPH